MKGFSHALLAKYTLGLIVIGLIGIPVLGQQKMDGIDRARMKEMLKSIKGVIKKDYYDDKFHGVDLDARFKLADEKLDQSATTGQSLAIIAQTLMDFDDSHLYFLPPATNLRVEYGWRMKMIGDKCLVTAVKPKSDAEQKGLKAGDQLLSIEGFKPTRKEMWKMLYYYNVLSKRQGLNVTALAPGAAAPREMNIAAKLTQVPVSVNDSNFFVLSNDYRETRNEKHIFQRVAGTAIWRMPSFDFDPAQIESIVTERIAGSANLVLDLRGNGGGYVKTLEELVGCLFDRDVKIAELKGRKRMDPIQSKTRKKVAFTGQLVVLIDSESGSAAEILARLVQLEKRGRVLGDVSAGAVMQARAFNGTSGTDYSSIFYGASVTNADVIMGDGKSVEHVGVIPDELLLNSPEDLQNGRDTVLSRAVASFGSQITPEAAAKLVAYDWTGK